MSTGGQNVSNSDELTIDQAASAFSVSIATIRNWIKTGYLERTKSGLISGESITKFKRENLGKDKLISRANKSKKDSHDHQPLQEKILSLLDSTVVDCAQLAEEYQSQLSNSYRNKEGVYYTPKHVICDFFDQVNTDCNDLTFCDPCCGSGNFIIEAIKKGFRPENIFGFDTDPVAVALTKKRIYDSTGYMSDNIVQGDFIQHHINDKCHRYDVIMTNPPWGKKINKDVKDSYAEQMGIKKSSDTSSFFFFASLGVLNENGYLGFLLQDAFFNIETFADARQKALSYQLVSIQHYGKLFPKLQTKAISVILRKNEAELDNEVKCRMGTDVYFRKQSSFSENPKQIFNINSNDNDAKIIKHLFSLPHRNLDHGVEWALGIVTGNNKKLVKSTNFAGGVPVYRGSDITDDCLKPPSSFISSDLSQYQQVAPEELYKAPQKIIYKFISNNPRFYVDKEQRYILNSANLIVLRDFPITHQQLANILNSDVMSWLFEKLFSTHKILQSDLISLPIHTEYFQQYELFNEDNFLQHLGLQRTESGYSLITVDSLSLIMCDRVESFRRGLFSLHTTRFGKVGEIFIQAMENLAGPESNFHDLFDPREGERVEVKCSRVLEANSEKITVENFIDQCINNDPESRPLDFEEREDHSWDCNMQQIKRDEFSRLYYLLFFRNRVLVFCIRSEQIGEDINFSDRQHGRDGEGQFHITDRNISHHIATYLLHHYTYNEFIQLFEDEE
ncbi:MAG: hypothetical protein CMJ72_00080 [Planctomycetaceae bacterium]|nr:hypothetical protein [Planctomycetaceae bacterium]